MNVPLSKIEHDADAARARVLDLVLQQRVPILIVDSPPGAGKTTLVELIAALAVLHQRLRVAIVAQRNEQVFDIVNRLATKGKPLPLQVLLARDESLPTRISSHPRVPTATSDVKALQPGPGIVVCTSTKLFMSMPNLAPNSFDLLICDEAYQLMAKDYLPLFDLAAHHLLIGDPGQLPPVVTVDTAYFEAKSHKVHWAAPRYLLAHHPAIPVVSLPATQRLTADTVRFIQPSFYPNLDFASLVPDGERAISYGAIGLGGPVDRALDLVAAGASVVGVLLPPRATGGDVVDQDVVALAADVGTRLLERGASCQGQPLFWGDIGYIDPNVTPGDAIEAELRRRGAGVGEAKIGTPEIWQGLERPVIIARHPLSGKRRLRRDFDLTPGRFCVMMSRHRSACILVGRDGVREALDEYTPDCGARAKGAANVEWQGWQAHDFIWDELERSRRLIRV